MHLMGIVNVTPDSFSDGGRWDTAETAIAHGVELLDQGASILDIGGESTRPGAQALSWEQEWERIAPVVAELAMIAHERKAMVSVDTYHAETARRAVEAGADIVNDVTGGRGDAAMFDTVAGLSCDYILQHSRGTADTMNALAEYHEATSEVIDELLNARDRAVKRGIDAERIILDPGIGFAKLGDTDWEILANIDHINSLGHRVLVGVSRKRFIGRLVGDAQTDRDISTAAISGYLAQHAVWGARVHDVRSSSLVVSTLSAIQRNQTLAN
ncbi:dihydropteroate synthase [Arcanobacterium phocisimile]|uniref:Dihydropteroate synthase n=1 Tax=Arcanobacterium phocisimile TaxID=1302235 RepID=A0ABX7IHI0_9ACTO|nr:dihydropteroate synthase [Arcanobacterium phocisimile]QRV02417.1 dihydropteroate synthase [Arcanobacterium phocisimile]